MCGGSSLEFGFPQRLQGASASLTHTAVRTVIRCNVSFKPADIVTVLSGLHILSRWLAMTKANSPSVRRHGPASISGDGASN
jgi:hypothetical protein